MAAKFVALGATTVPTGGTPVGLSIPTSLTPPKAHSLLLQPLPTNTGRVYLGTVGLNRTTLAAVLAILPVPTANALPAFTASLAVAANALALEDLYVDVEVNGEGVFGSVLVA